MQENTRFNQCSGECMKTRDGSSILGNGEKHEMESVFKSNAEEREMEAVFWGMQENTRWKHCSGECKKTLD
jgi:hypothetical protein